MIRAIIIDDETKARSLLQNHISQSLGNRVTVIAEGDDVGSGIEAIRNHQPDLVFLDIRMHEGTGFDLLEKIGHVDFEVIFVTAYDEYAIKAIQFSAFGYLLKPIKPQDLIEVVDRLEGKLERLRANANPRVKVLIENYSDDRTIRKLIINHMNGFDVSLVEDILRLEGDGNYTHFMLSSGRRVTTSRTLGEYEELLLPHGFYRIHQSTIVNLRHVSRYHKGTGGTVEMTDGKRLKVSRYRKSGFLQHFSGE